MTHRTRALVAMATVLFGCGRDDQPVAVDTTVLVTVAEYPLVGEGVRRGWVRADSVLFDQDFESARLIRPQLTLLPTARRSGQVEIAADSGRLVLGGQRVLLFQPSRVTGGNATLAGQDSVWYDPEEDSLWTGSPRTPDADP